MALASLFAQTLQSWECVVVDDGSTDGLQEWMLSVTDSRVRYRRLETNNGRGYAHQCALDLARGDFFCTIDGDDWIYPDKLQTQVSFLQARPEIAAVSTGLAKVDKGGCLRAIDRIENQVYPAGQLDFSRFYFGTAMCRTQEARKVGFRPEFRRSQDFDFFVRLLLTRPYAVLGCVAYVYDYAQAATVEVVLEGLKFNQKTLVSVVKNSPVVVLRKLFVCTVKIVVYPWLSRFGLWGWLSQRSPKPTIQDEERFRQALKVVSQEFLTYRLPNTN